MITDRIFISSSKSEEGRKGIARVTEELSRIKRNFDFFREMEKFPFASANHGRNILDRLTNCGVTILILSSDFLGNNSHLLRKKENGEIGWNYEELRASLTWNQKKMFNSIIVVYTDEFFFKYLKNPHLLSFPIINDNINNLNKLRASDLDSSNYLEVISLTEFLSNSKTYLNKVDKRKLKQSITGLYSITI